MLMGSLQDSSDRTRLHRCSSCVHYHPSIEAETVCRCQASLLFPLLATFQTFNANCCLVLSTR